MPLVVFAGKEYGTGSSRDWAAKGTRLLGIRAVIAQSFERIHRSNLVGMGVLPLVFEDGQSWQGLGITGKETVTIRGLAALRPRQKLAVNIVSAPTARPATSRCSAASIPRRSSSTTGTAASCPFVLRNLASAAWLEAPAETSIPSGFARRCRSQTFPAGRAAKFSQAMRSPLRLGTHVSHPFVTRT